MKGFSLTWQCNYAHVTQKAKARFIKRLAGWAPLSNVGVKIISSAGQAGFIK